jgi:hypothetical protein
MAEEQTSRSIHRSKNVGSQDRRTFYSIEMDSIQWSVTRIITYLVDVREPPELGLGEDVILLRFLSK